MSTRALGLGSPLRKTLFSPSLARNPSLIRTTFAKRAVQTESLPPSAAVDILNKQRLLRPSSPHFTIYPAADNLDRVDRQPRHRGRAQRFAVWLLPRVPLRPGTFDSVHVVEFYAGKALLAAPFAFHGLNGIRHLSWDMGKFMSIKSVSQTGYAVLGGTAISTVALLFL
ncbi:hypothetical protein B0H14DRAFT_3475287 [Mycena olivaceomarginata]|nr:hypothetical protein B0H14DRAFT_3475287 [Mycena olivaceomarginata]